MKALFVSSDPTLFKESAARARMRVYAGAIGESHIVSVARSGAAEIHEGPLHIYPVRSGKLLRIPAFMFQACSLARKRGIEVVSAQDPFEYGLIAYCAARLSGARLHLQLHTDPFAPAFARAGLVNRIRILLMSFLIPRARGIRVVSSVLQRHIERQYAPRAPIQVQSIYTDIERFRSVRRNPDPLSLLWIGRLEKEKNPALALHALAHARRAGYTATLTVLGSGSQENTLRALARTLSVEDAVSFVGHTDPVPFLERTALVLSTSDYEGYGLSIVEALAAGVPVLSTDVGIAREAGAQIASAESFGEELVEWLRGGPRSARLLIHPDTSLEHSARAVADGLLRTFPQ